MKRAAVFALFTALPFALLEMINNRGALVDRVVLFGTLWLLPFAFFALMRTRTHAALRIVGMVAIAAFWGTLVIDQMPCFLGVPNCD